MKFIIGLGAVLFLLVTPPPPAQADSVQMQCPGSVKEGGLVAEAVNDCGGRWYCQYRDGPGTSDWSDAIEPEPRRVKSAWITINATTGGQWLVWQGSGQLRFVIADPAGGIRPSLQYNVAAGETKKIEVNVYGRGEYRKAGNATGTIYVGPPGSSSDADAIASCTVTVQDDDNSIYIGRRRSHPYGGTWRSRPHCYTQDCAYD